MKTRRLVYSRKALFSMGMVFLLLWAICMMGECANYLYGKPVKYALGKEIEYPDFTVRFIGTRREIPEVYPRGFLYYDFEIISRKGGRSKVSWSSGTGELGPIEFSIDGQFYFLELKTNSLATDPKERWLKEDELIFWRREIYLEKQEEIGK